MRPENRIEQSSIETVEFSKRSKNIHKGITTTRVLYSIESEIINS